MKTIVITGASRGIGKAIAKKFYEENFNIALCARNLKELLLLKDELLAQPKSGEILVTVADVCNKNDRIEFVEKAFNKFKNIDVLVNNAGTFLPGKTYNEPDGTLMQLLQTNLISAYEITRLIVPKMIEKKQGHVFNMSSIAGLQAYENGGAYSISKFALTGFSKNLRLELKEFNIRVSTVYPGAVLTDSWAGTNLPKERFIMSEDVADVIYNAYQLHQSTLVEDIILRPLLGDI